MSSKDSTDYQDVITFEQQGIVVVKTEEKIQKLFDGNLEPIVIILREGPLTIKELVKKYNMLADESKSEMTIYRYLKELDKIGVVTEVGKRLKHGQSATETLYGRTAKVFWNVKEEEDYWKSVESKKFLDPLHQLVNLYIPDTKVSSNHLRDLLSLTYKTTTDEIALFLEQNQESLTDIFTGLSFKDVDKILDLLSNVILLMKRKDFAKELEKCGC